MKGLKIRRIDNKVGKVIPPLVRQNNGVCLVTFSELARRVKCTEAQILMWYQRYAPSWPEERNFFPVGVNALLWKDSLTNEELRTITEEDARRYVWKGPYIGISICISKNGGLFAAKAHLRDRKKVGIEEIETRDISLAKKEGLISAGNERGLASCLSSVPRMVLAGQVEPTKLPQLIS